MSPDRLILPADDVPVTPFVIPGANPGPTAEFRIQLLNEDADRGVVTSIVHLPPGGRIPAHVHHAGSEMHFVLEGDMTDQGKTHGPGGFLTHAAGVVHGPHESRGGARVLTVQQWQSIDGKFDFNLVEDQGGEQNQDTRNQDTQNQDRAPRQDGGETGQAAPITGAGDPTRDAAEQSVGKGYG